MRSRTESTVVDSHRPPRTPTPPLEAMQRTVSTRRALLLLLLAAAVFVSASACSSDGPFRAEVRLLDAGSSEFPDVSLLAYLSSQHTELCAAREPVDLESLDTERNVCWRVGELSAIEVPQGNLATWVDSTSTARPPFLALGVSGLDLELGCGQLAWKEVPLPAHDVSAYFGVIIDEVGCGDRRSFEFTDGTATHVVETG